jgi:hypothetical protein
MSHSRSRVLGIVLGSLALLAWSAPVSAQIQNNLEAQMAVMDEALAGVATTMISFTGQCDTTAQLEYQSVFAGPNGQATLKGTFAGMPVDVHIDSFFDVFTDFSDVGFTGVGAGIDFSGGGPDVSGFDQSRMIQLMNVKANGAVPWDFHVIKDYVIRQVPAGQQIIDDGLVVITRLGRPISKWRQTSVFQRYPPFKRTLTKIRVAPNPGCKAVLKGTVNGSNITGKVNVK